MGSINELLDTDKSPEKAMKEFLTDYAENNDSIKKMDFSEISIGENNPIGCKFNFPQNMFCPIHNEYHDIPSNCTYVNAQMALMIVTCSQSSWNNVFPNNGISVPQNVINIITGNTINNTTNNNYCSGNDNEKCIIVQDYQQDNIPFFKNDNQTQVLLFKSFTGKHNDVARFVNRLWSDEFRYIPDYF